MSFDILVIDDEADIRELVGGILADEGYQPRTAGNSDDALSEIKARRPQLVLLDIWLQGSRLDGLELLDTLRTEHPDLPVIMISGHGNIETAVSTIKRGAFDFIEKPFETDHLLHLVQRATETARLRRENQELRERAPYEDFLAGTSPAVQNLRRTIEKVATTNSRVLICGPSGSGKEMAARRLHDLSPRANAPFVAVNAASMSPETMEIELFGSEQAPEGAPGGRKIGVFEYAHGGTLYLDEVAEMPLKTQSKILRVLVDQTFERVGGASKVQVDVRVVSATSRDLAAEIEAGNFREDLYHRLNVVPIDMPPLSDRREDIPELVEYFIARISSGAGLAKKMPSAEAMTILQAYHWPGNIRQLRNVIERMLILADENVIRNLADDGDAEGEERRAAGLFATEDGSSLMAAPLREARETFEREYLKAQISRFGGNISRTAEFIGMERSALHRKLKSLGLQPSEIGRKTDHA